MIIVSIMFEKYVPPFPVETAMIVQLTPNAHVVRYSAPYNAATKASYL